MIYFGRQKFKNITKSFCAEYTELIETDSHVIIVVGVSPESVLAGGQKERLCSSNSPTVLR